MREKNKIKIVLSLLIAVSFLLPVSSVMGSDTTPKEIVKAVNTTTQQLGKATGLTVEKLDGRSSSPLVNLQGTYPVDITEISIDGTYYYDDDIIKSGLHDLDVQICRTAYALEDPICQQLPAQVKVFIDVFKKNYTPIPKILYPRYFEDFEDPCEIALNWSTIDVPICCGPIDGWTWSDKRYCSAGHSMHNTMFDQYLPNQEDILLLNFGGTPMNFAGNDTVTICWCQFIEGDAATYIQDYGMFQYSFDNGMSWNQLGNMWYTSNGTTETICLNLTLDPLDPADDNIIFRWVWISDAIFCYEGWYIDDVKITGVKGGNPDTYTWDFVMDSWSFPLDVPGECIDYVFNETWFSTIGEYRICAWLQALDDCHFSSTEYSDPYCIYIEIGDITEFEIDCSNSWYYTADPKSPAWDGDDFTVCYDITNAGTLDATNVQVQFIVQRGELKLLGKDDMERNNNATTGMLSTMKWGMTAAETAMEKPTEWLKRAQASNVDYAYTNMTAGAASYAHYTTYDKTEGAKSLAMFREIGIKPWYYTTFASSDALRGPLLWKVPDKNKGIFADYDITVSADTNDAIRLGIVDWVAGWTYGITWTPTAGNAIFWPWQPVSNIWGGSIYGLEISDLIKGLAPYAVPLSTYALYIRHYKYAPLGNQNPANPRNNEWSGVMVDNVVYKSLIIQPPIIYTQTINIPMLNVSETKTVCFKWDNMTVGQYAFTFKILNADSDPDDNQCVELYEVYNWENCASDMTCVDNTIDGIGHWVEESCCGGYFWAGDPATTMYGINWTDALYLRNATGGLNFNLTTEGFADACLEFDTWFQFDQYGADLLDFNDFGVVQASNDGGIHWVNLTQYTVNSTDLIWGADPYTGFFHDTLCVSTMALPITDYMQFRFVFISNGSGVARGWILDNIELNDGGTNVIFGPDPAVNFNHFYRTDLGVGCWWFTPDWWGYTPGWSNYDPAIFMGPFTHYYVDNQNSSIVWTLDMDASFYGILHYWDALDLDPSSNDFGYVEVSTDGGVTWNVLKKEVGGNNGWVTISLGDYDMYPTLLIRFRMKTDGVTNGLNTPYWGWTVEDVCFWGMTDHQAPVTKAEMAGTLDEKCHWYTSCVKIKLTATDDIAGVAHIYYELDGVQYEYTGLITICEDGDHTFCFWAVDTEGNTEAKQCLPPFRIDLTGPTVSITAPQTGYLYLMGNQLFKLKSGKTIFLFDGIPVTASVTAQDAAIDVVRFYLDDVLLAEDTTAPYSVVLSTKHSGPAVLKVTAVDTVGHSASATLNIDNYVKFF